MDQLHIASLRPGVNARVAGSTNYDEAKANPYPDLPDPLTMKNGKKVTSAKMWWDQRRPEIVEDFDREVYGRVPKSVPNVKWEVTKTANESVGDVPIVTKTLVGHVDNSAYPEITVDIQLSLSTPANAKTPVPVIMVFGGGPGAGRGAPPAVAPAQQGAEPGPSWQAQVLAKGWGFATLNPASIQADNGAGLRKGIIGLVNKGEPRKPEDWGALRAWAWGADRAMDYFETDKAVDAKHVAIQGHSRYGKAAVVTMAYDPRIAIAFVSSSGEGGAKLHRRNFGELVENVAGDERIPLDGRQLFEVCRPAEVERSACRFARTDRDVRSASRIPQRREPGRSGGGYRTLGRMGGRQGTFHGGGRRGSGLPAAGQEGSGHESVSSDRDWNPERRSGLPPAQRGAYAQPELALFPGFRRT